MQIVEDSIQQAYIDAIQKAQHYVYIENQFFITLAQANANVQNRIGEALLGRILQAHRYVLYINFTAAAAAYVRQTYNEL